MKKSVAAMLAALLCAAGTVSYDSAPVPIPVETPKTLPVFDQGQEKDMNSQEMEEAMAEGGIVLLADRVIYWEGEEEKAPQQQGQGSGRQAYYAAEKPQAAKPVEAESTSTTKSGASLNLQLDTGWKAPDTPAQSRAGGNSASTGSKGAASKSIDVDAFAREVFRLVNIERKKAGLDEVVWDDDMTYCAMIRAEEMTRRFGHTRPDTPLGEGKVYNPFTVADELGIPHNWIMENAGAGYQTPAAVVQGWMNSSGHRANILTVGHVRCGVGVYDTNEKTQSGWQRTWALWFDSYDPESGSEKEAPVITPPVVVEPDRQEREQEEQQGQQEKMLLEEKKNDEPEETEIEQQQDAQPEIKEEPKDPEPKEEEEQAADDEGNEEGEKEEGREKHSGQEESGEEAREQQEQEAEEEGNLEEPGREALPLLPIVPEGEEGQTEENGEE